MTFLNHDCHRYTQIQYLLPILAPRYIVFSLKNMANESKAFRSLFKMEYYVGIIPCTPSRHDVAPLYCLSSAILKPRFLLVE